MGPEHAASGAIQRQESKKSPNAFQKHERSRRHSNVHEVSSGDLPGVQKLKAAVRQTRRLLLKDTLAADVRRETERRLKSLESDLQTVELKRKERTMAKKYHKIKFFERRKVLRKIKKVKKELDQGESTSSKEAATRLENALFELRAQLNYILNYPKLEKYVSLFPPSKEKDEQNQDLDNVDQPPKGETDARREELLSSIKQRMVLGELSGEPEIEAEGNGAHASSSAKQGSRSQRRPTVGDAPIASTGTRRQTEKSGSQKTIAQDSPGQIGDDDFFDVESNSETGSDSAE